MNFNSSTALCSINKHSNELPACRLFAQNVFNSRGCVMNIGWLILTRDAVLTMEERSAAVAIAHKKWIDCHHSTAQADPVSGWTLAKDLRVTTQSSLDCPEAVKTHSNKQCITTAVPKRAKNTYSDLGPHSYQNFRRQDSSISGDSFCSSLWYSHAF